MLAITMAAYPEMMAPDGLNGLLDVNLWPIQNGVLAFCGFDVLAPFVADSVPYSDDSARAGIIADYGRRLAGLGSDFTTFGFVIVGVFAATWLLSAVVYRWPRFGMAVNAA